VAPTQVRRGAAALAAAVVLLTLGVALATVVPSQASEVPSSAGVAPAERDVAGGYVAARAGVARQARLTVRLAVAQLRAEHAARLRAQARATRLQALRQQHLERWVLPVTGAVLSAGFGEAGPHWASGEHTGQDFLVPFGAAVRAAHAGEVVFAGWGGRYGNLVEIAHPDGTRTWYAHLAAITRTSGHVRTGAMVGTVGCSGNCFGTHLHFEVRLDADTAVDPLVWLRLRGVRLP